MLPQTLTLCHRLTKRLILVSPKISSKILFEQYGDIIEEVNIFYDIENLESKKSKEDFYQIKPKNITELKLKYE